CAWRRYLRTDARARPRARAEGGAGRFRAGGRIGLSVRSPKLRPVGVPLRRDVLRRARGFLRQSAPCVAAVRPARLRLLARAARQSLDDGAAAGDLSARAQAAAGGTGG